MSRSRLAHAPVSMRCALALSFLVMFPPMGMASRLPSRQTETILVFRPSSRAFELAHDGLVATLDGSIVIEKFLVDQDTTVADMAGAIARVHPRMIVLMNNESVNLFRRWQSQLPGDSSVPPSIILMTLYAGEAIRGLENSAGITYEVPGISSLHYLRSLVNGPLQRVGVLYSSPLADYFDHQKRFCEKEKIELIGVQLPSDKLVPRDIRKALRWLLRDREIDALWVFNDSLLLSEKNLTRGWQPILLKCNKPILVGVENLIEVGHLGVFPDHYRMGEQAAFMVLDAWEDGWQLTGEPVRAPIGVVKTVNLSRVKPAEIRLNAEVLDEMDRIIQ